MKKLVQNIIAACSCLVGSFFVIASVSNAELSVYTDTPLVDDNLLLVIGVIALMPFIVIGVKRRFWWDDVH